MSRIKHVGVFVHMPTFYHSMVSATNVGSGQKAIVRADLFKDIVTEEMQNRYGPDVIVDATWYAYVKVSPKFRGSRYFKTLENMGFVLRKIRSDRSGELSSAIQLDLVSNSRKFDAVYLLDGCGVIVSAVKYMRIEDPNKDIIFIGVPDIVHSDLRPIVEIVALDPNKLVEVLDGGTESWEEKA